MERLDILKANEYKFWLRVKKGNTYECWVWMRYKDKNGYGDFQFCYMNKKYSFKSHRTSYELINGKIPDGLLVCHKCDNPECVNPNHLFIGTHKDNVDDKFRKGRQAKAETNGKSKLTWDIVIDIRKTFNKKMTISKLAKKHSVDKTCIGDILTCRTWKDENYTPIKFEYNRFRVGNKDKMVISEEKVIQVKKLIKEGLKPKEISIISEVKHQTVKDIKRGVAYFNIKV